MGIVQRCDQLREPPKKDTINIFINDRRSLSNEAKPRFYRLQLAFVLVLCPPRD
jgi:hypothetical protein